MKDRNAKTGMAGAEQAGVLLAQMLRLKAYETPDPARMARNKQNIMRAVRIANGAKRKGLGERLENSIPWFFAEPRYGIAVLFVVFAGLQFLGANGRHRTRGETGIYTHPASMADLARNAPVAATNSVSYPRLPDGTRLFEAGRAEGDVKFVAHRLE